MKYLALLLLLFPLGLSAADVTITWTPPSERVDGSALTEAEIKQYNIYLNGALDGSVPGTQTTASKTGLPVGQACFHVTTVDLGDIESILSNEFCVDILPTSPPNPPTIMDIQVTIEQ